MTLKTSFPVDCGVVVKGIFYFCNMITQSHCNALLFGLPKYQLDRLQKVQNSAARVTFQIAKFDHITPALIDLH